MIITLKISIIKITSIVLILILIKKHLKRHVLSMKEFTTFTTAAQHLPSAVK